MREYELTVLIHPDLEADLEPALKKVRDIVTSNKGEVKKEDNWGKKRLAYRLNKEDFGIYVYFEVELPAESVAKINQKFRITEEIMRYLVISLEDIMYINQPAPKEAKSAEKGEK